MVAPNERFNAGRHFNIRKANGVVKMAEQRFAPFSTSVKNVLKLIQKADGVGSY